MKLELTSHGAKVVVQSDDGTTMTVAFRDEQTEDTIAFNCVSVDMFELIDGIKSCMTTPKNHQFVEGERVIEERLGIGTVIAMSTDKYYGVAFDKQIGRLHNCTQADIVWGKRGTKNNCYWVRASDIISVAKPKLCESETFCERFRRYMEKKKWGD